jgi:hypothetical protein
MASYDPDIQLAAIRIVISALIESHPNKKEFLASLDAALAGLQKQSLEKDAQPPLAPEVLSAIASFRGHAD